MLPPPTSEAGTLDGAVAPAGELIERGLELRRLLRAFSCRDQRCDLALHLREQLGFLRVGLLRPSAGPAR